METLRKKMWFLSLSVFLITICLHGCKKNKELTPEQEKIVSSLVRVNDYPFFTLKYDGDYGFDKFQKTGVRPGFYSYDVNQGDGFQCTCIAAMGSDECKRFGRNFDWTTSSALLLFTYPSDGYASISMINMSVLGYNVSNTPDIPGNNYNLLVAPYQSLDGMNEKGVAIGLMAVDHASPPHERGRISLYTTEMIRLVLDYAANVDEAIDLIRNHNIIFGGSIPVHYLIADKSGNSAIVEFLDNDVKVTRNTEYWQVSTNFVFYDIQDPKNANCYRYNIASSALEKHQGNISMENAMDIMKMVTQGSPYFTMWSVVYDLNNLEAEISIDRDNSKRYKFSISDQEYEEIDDVGCSDENFALNKPAISSSEENATLSAKFAVDGDMRTRWSSQWNEPEWIQIDLEQVTTITGVSLFWENASAGSYKIEVSNNNIDWGEIYSTSSSLGGNECISFDPISARYIRLTGSERWTEYGFSLWELQVHAEPGGIIIAD